MPMDRKIRRRKVNLRPSVWFLGRGYVVLNVSGDRPERFLNICLRRHLPIWGLERLADAGFCVCMLAKDFRKNVRAISKKSGCRVSVKDKRGLLFWLRRYGNRRVLWGGGFALLALAVLLSSLLWSVRVEGGTEEARTRTRALLAGLGVRPGTFLYRLDSQFLADSLLSSQPELSWVGVESKGTTLVIRLVEATQDPSVHVIPADVPCDIVAKKDGVIQKLVVEQGTSAVEMYTTVQAGQVLIRGEVDPKDPQASEIRPVHARGQAWGLVWYTAKASVEEEILELRETGVSRERQEWLLFGLSIPCPWKRGKAFEQGSSVTTEEYLSLPNGLELPIGIRKTVYRETANFYQTLSQEEAIEEAKLRALYELEGMLSPDGEIINTSYTLREENGCLVVILSAECLEDLGIEKARENTG